MTYIAVAVVVSLVIAGIALFVMRSGHNTVKPFTDGQAYLKEQGVVFDIIQDRFVSTHTTKIPKPKKDDD